MLLSQVICPRCKTMWSLSRGCNCPEHLEHARISKQWNAKIAVCDELSTRIENQCSCNIKCNRYLKSIGLCASSNEELRTKFRQCQREISELKQVEAAAFARLHEHARQYIYPMLSK